MNGKLTHEGDWLFEGAPFFPTIDSSENPYFIELFYNEEENLFYDEEGIIVWAIFDVVTPNDLLLFRNKRQYMILKHRYWPSVLVELYWSYN